MRLGVKKASIVERARAKALDDTILCRSADSNAALLIDFDHTLFEGNSTELFIASCEPAWLVAIFDFSIRKAVPWRILRGGHRRADYLCVRILSLATPWNVRHWQQAAPALFAQLENQKLSDPLQATGSTIISFGQSSVIEALVAGSRWAEAAIIATPARAAPSYFLRNKSSLARGSLSEGEIATAKFVTDSSDDDDLLSIVASPLKIAPAGEPVRAAERLYLPLRYSASKYTVAYVFDQFILVDCAVLSLATSHSMSEALILVPIVASFMLSMMCVYEVGYFENDMVAAAKEAKPTLSGRESRFRRYPIVPDAYAWSAALACLATVAGHVTGLFSVSDSFRTAAIWLLVLACTRLTFLAYNRVSVAWRVVGYPLLQLEKFGLLVLLAPTCLGLCLAASQVAMMTITYARYRLTKRRPDHNRDLLRAVLFALFYAAISVVQGQVLLAPAPLCAAVLAWLTIRIFKPYLVSRFRRQRARTPATRTTEAFG